eukprot:284579_1
MTLHPSTAQAVPTSGDHDEEVPSINHAGTAANHGSRPPSISTEHSAPRISITSVNSANFEMDQGGRDSVGGSKDESRNSVKMEGVNLYIAEYRSKCTANLDPFPEDEFKSLCDKYKCIFKGDSERRTRSGALFNQEPQNISRFTYPILRPILDNLAKHRVENRVPLLVYLRAYEMFLSKPGSIRPWLMPRFANG